MVIVDIVILVMMAITVGFCWKLNNKIIQLQKGKHELAKLFQFFDHTLERAENEIKQIRDQTGKMATTLNKRIDLTKHLIDDLSNLQQKARLVYESLEIIVSEGKELNNQLETITSSSQQQQLMAATRPPANLNHGHQVVKSKTRNTQSDNRIPYKPPTAKVPTVSESEKQRVAIENLLKKISEANNV